MRYILFIVLSIFIFSACSSEKKSDQLKKKVQEAESVSQEPAFTERNSKMVYRVPTPIEFFMFYKNAGGSFRSDDLLPVEDVSNYLSSKEKAIAFGVYASDLAYSAVFEQNQSTISYFETGKKLGDDLGFTEGYGEDLMKRFQDNLNNVDSLYNLTADSYWQVFNFLEDQDKVILLSYITIAGWVESLYQSFNSIEKFEQNEIIHSLADQQYVIENLYAFVSEIHINKGEKDDIIQIAEELLKAYELLYENSEEVIMTEEQFNTIKEVVVRNREKLVK